MQAPVITSIQRIYASALKLLTLLSPDQTYQTIVNEALTLIDADTGLIVLREKNVFRIVYSTSQPAGRIIVREKGFTYRAFQNNEAFVIHADEVRASHPELPPDSIRSAVFVPLFSEEEVNGVLVLHSKTDKEFGEDVLEVMKLFGSLASMSIRKMQLYYNTQQALRTRDLFISMASHELRTPLTTITLYAQMLYERVLDGKPIQESWTKNLQMETKRLTHLVNELLQIDSIKKGYLHYIPRECSLRDIVDRAVTDFRLIHPQYHVQVVDKTNGENLLACDFDKILQVILNLLNNAAKFSQPESLITLTLLKKNKCLCVRVKDRGKGITKQELPHIFTQFYKGNSHRKDGMGLGLYLTKNIIEKHGGSIGVRSEVAQGTTVEITLPT